MKPFLPFIGLQRDAGFRIGQRYTGTPQPEGTVLVATAGGQPGTGITLKADEWEKWFKK
ncbi:hypothetical protein [Hymenobacter baengnokdamensis]|uniref:hypothetical protein n=1 Tax=Hymenobacter baengnokdamensis TaxID=2615203 RepID=UPI001782E815|nr:hypothetical protein [Hymenobacter baengnokdamensis]